MGKVIAICTSPARGTQKHQVPAARFTVEWGIEGDAHGGSWHRQVSLLSADKIAAFNARGANVQPGAFGENLVVEGFDFRALPVGTLLRCGDVLLEMTQIGKECHSHCEIYKRMGECIMPTQGVFARVLEPGEIRVGDEMEIQPRTEPRPWQAAVITLSDKGARGERRDESGPAIAKRALEFLHTYFRFTPGETQAQEAEEKRRHRPLLALFRRRDQADLLPAVRAFGHGFGEHLVKGQGGAGPHRIPPHEAQDKGGGAGPRHVEEGAHEALQGPPHIAGQPQVHHQGGEDEEGEQGGDDDIVAELEPLPGGLHGLLGPEHQREDGAQQGQTKKKVPDPLAGEQPVHGTSPPWRRTSPSGTPTW